MNCGGIFFILCVSMKMCAVLSCLNKYDTLNEDQSVQSYGLEEYDNMWQTSKQRGCMQNIEELFSSSSVVFIIQSLRNRTDRQLIHMNNFYRLLSVCDTILINYNNKEIIYRYNKALKKSQKYFDCGTLYSKYAVPLVFVIYTWWRWW